MMTQTELNRAVASATGETVQVISDRGFVPLTAIPFEREPLRAPQMVDWDELDAERNSFLTY